MFTRFVSPLQKIAQEHHNLDVTKCEVIYPYSIPPWLPTSQIEIAKEAEAAPKIAEPRQGLTAVLSPSCRQGIVGVGGAIYSPLMPGMTEASLDSFSCSVASRSKSNIFTADLYGICHSLKLMASV